MTASSDYPVLGFDPAPGTIATVQSVANDYQQVATKMGEAHDALSRIGQQDGIWVGKAAEAFASTVGDLPKYLDQAHRSLGDAAKTLTQWSDQLTSLQRTAHDYEAQAAQAQRRVREAQSNPNLNLAGQTFPDQASLQQAQAKLDAAEAELNRATGDLDAIREQAQRLLSQHDDLAKTVEDALRRAAEEAPDAPSLLERLTKALDQLGQDISDAAGKTWQWVKDHADTINKVGDVLSTAGTVLSVVAAATSWIPGVNAVTAAAAVGVSAAAIGAHALAKAAGAKVSWSTMAFDALGVIPGAGAAKGAGAVKVLPRVAKASSSAAKAAEGGKLAAGVEAAGKTFKQAGSEVIGSNAHSASKLIPEKLWKPQVAEVGTQSGWLGKTEKVYRADSGAAVALGAGAMSAKSTAVMVGKWEAQPYIEKGENMAKDYVGKASTGFHNALAER